MIKLRAIAILLLALVAVPCAGQTSKALATVDTVADLVARNPTTGERVVLNGWLAPGDFGAPRIVRHVPSSVLSTNWGCVFDSLTGNYEAEDCDSLTVDVRWFGGTNNATTLARALTWVLQQPSPSSLVNREIVLVDTTAPTAQAGTMALYATNVSGVHELGIAHGGGSNNVVATKAWVASSTTTGTVTSIGATSSVSGLSFSGSPITTTGTLGLTGVVGVASGGTGATNSTDARSNLGLGSAATNSASAFQPASAALTALAANDGSALTGLNGSSISTGTVADARIDAAIARDAEMAALYQPLDAQLTVVADLTGGTGSNFLRGDGTFAQVSTNDIPGLVVALSGVGVAQAYALAYGTNIWTQSIVGLTTNGGFELPVIEWAVSQTIGAVPVVAYYDLPFGTNTWRTAITNETTSGGFTLPVFEVRKL